MGVGVFACVYMKVDPSILAKLQRNAAFVGLDLIKRTVSERLLWAGVGRASEMAAGGF